MIDIFKHSGSFIILPESLLTFCQNNFSSFLDTTRQDKLFSFFPFVDTMGFGDCWYHETCLMPQVTSPDPQTLNKIKLKHEKLLNVSNI